MAVSIVHVMDLAKTPQYPVAQSMNVVPPLALDSWIFDSRSRRARASPNDCPAWVPFWFLELILHLRVSSPAWKSEGSSAPLLRSSQWNFFASTVNFPPPALCTGKLVSSSNAAVPAATPGSAAVLSTTVTEAAKLDAAKASKQNDARQSVFMAWLHVDQRVDPISLGGKHNLK